MFCPYFHLLSTSHEYNIVSIYKYLHFDIFGVTFYNNKKYQIFTPSLQQIQAPWPKI